MDRYWELASPDVEQRLAASKALIEELKNNPGVAEREYALGRLVKGLASGREASRLGFAVTLTEMLRDEAVHVDILKTVDAIVEQTRVSGSTSGQEERDLLFGRLFGLESIVQSGRLMNQDGWTMFERIVDLLFELAQKKSWLREACAKVLCNALVSSVDRSQACKLLQRKMSENKWKNNMQSIAIMLTMQRLQNLDKSPLHLSNLQDLARVLKGNQEDADTGSFTPHLHFVWQLILDVLLDQKSATASFREFWKIVVDEGLFSMTSSNERKGWGFLFFSLSLPVADRSDVLSLFSPAFSRALVNHLSNTSSTLHKAAKKAVSTMQKVAEEQKDKGPFIVQGLLTENGSPVFDRLTKSKTVANLIVTLDEEGLLAVVDIFRDVILNDDDDSTSSGIFNDGRRQWAADQIVGIIRNGKVIKSESVMQRALDLFIVYGYFSSTLRDTASMFRSRLSACLSGLTQDSWSVYVVRKILARQKKTPDEFLIEMDDAVWKEVRRSMKRVQQMQNDESNSSVKLGGIQKSWELFFTHTILDLFDGDAEAFASLNDALSVDDQQGQNGTAFTELVLNMMTKGSASSRRVSEQVFSSSVTTMTLDSLQLLLDVLKTPESVAGQEQLFENGEDKEMEDGSTQDGEQPSDDQSMGTSGTSESETEDESEDEVDAEIGEEEAKFNKALADALQTKETESGHESESLMDDDEMMAIDEQIADIFRQREPNKKPSKRVERKQARGRVVNLKTQVLGLLEILVRRVQGAENQGLLVSLYFPLLVFTRTTSDFTLRGKARRLLRDRLCRAKVTAISDEDTLKVLQEVHTEAERGGDSCCSAASLCLYRMLKDKKQGDDIYIASFTNWARNANSRMIRALFVDFVNQRHSVAH